MTLTKTASALAALALTFGAPLSPAMAGPATSAWGTQGSGGAQGQALYSAQLHKTEGENAQIQTIGRDITSMYRSVTSCGNCVYNTITGDANSINGNTIDGKNSGDISATGNFKN
ncbi:MAG: hypothetical protein ACKVOL_15285 [Novosphingobium sp.]